MHIDLAAFRLHALSTLTTDSNATTASHGSDFLSALMAAQTRSPLPASGSLPDAGSGSLERMNSVLAQLEASNAHFLQRYNARVEEIGDEAAILGRLRERMSELGEASTALSALTPQHEDAQLTQALQAFVARYNAWDAEFDPYFEPGGLLRDNTAGEVARFSLRREVGSIFHGAGHGGYELGLSDMGLSFTADGQLKLDEAGFSAALSRDRPAAVQTLDNMARAFAEAAALLSSDGHLLERRIDNAERASHWAAAQQQAIDKEFGPGTTSLQSLLGRLP